MKDCATCGRPVVPPRIKYCCALCQKRGRNPELYCLCGNAMRHPSPTGLCGFCIIEREGKHARF